MMVESTVIWSNREEIWSNWNMYNQANLKFRFLHMSRRLPKVIGKSSMPKYISFDNIEQENITFYIVGQVFNLIVGTSR